uniref:Putative secreted protein n=1 Tax=Anopheles darlingi TaxID=43151 RepID=A0A2M4DGV5_ANODA
MMLLVCVVVVGTRSRSGLWQHRPVSLQPVLVRAALSSSVSLCPCLSFSLFLSLCDLYFVSAFCIRSGRLVVRKRCCMCWRCKVHHYRSSSR